MRVHRSIPDSIHPRATISPPAICHFSGVLLVGCWWPTVLCSNIIILLLCQISYAGADPGFLERGVICIKVCVWGGSIC